MGGLSPSCTPSGYQSAPVTSLSSFSISLSVRQVEAAGERKEDSFYYKCSAGLSSVVQIARQLHAVVLLTVLVKTFSYQSLFADSLGNYIEYLTSVTAMFIAILGFCCRSLVYVAY